MARIKLKIGENEIEIESRDFYVDNQTVSKVIDDLSRHLPDNQAKIVYETESTQELEQSSKFALECLDDAETFEPEFNEPNYIHSHQIKSKLRILETSGFFESPRTATETVQQLREYGWATSPLDVSKALAKMASVNEILRTSEDSLTHYFTQESLISN
ncbi:MAG: hypothetical protein GKS07_03680 [Nitrosopumilus sp.]|nr:MAG: hypothetical protein GKS07_03680 [Nitrosopumilus sp.]